MSTTEAPSTTRPSTAGRRFGYLVAIAVNATMLWVVNRLLVWGWPGFLTDAFEDLRPLVAASLIASMVVNAVFVLRDRGRIRALGDLVTSVFAVVVGLRTWEVFPFDFTGYATDWTWAVRTLIVLTIVGTSIAVLVHLGKLLSGRDDLEEARGR